ncbi:hypothetical protein GQ457_02G003340 [Hibiscus cannabinus]
MLVSDDPLSIDGIDLNPAYGEPVGDAAGGVAGVPPGKNDSSPCYIYIVGQHISIRQNPTVNHRTKALWRQRSSAVSSTKMTGWTNIRVMEGFKFLQFLAILSTLSVVSVKGQISTACTASMISTFTPCLNFITGSSGNGTSSPTQGCCGSLKSLMSSSMDCACLVFTANIPLQLPINRTLALSLPRACNMGGVPVQCKASGTPLPAPGPVPFLLPPTLPPTAASPLSPRASKASVPESDTPLDLAPASPPEDDEEPEAPSATIRPVIQPSASSPSYVSPPVGTSGSIIPRPEILKIRTTPRPTVAGPKDTPMDLVLEKTYDPKSGKGMPDL